MRNYFLSLVEIFGMAKTNFNLQSVIRDYFNFSKDQRRAFKMLLVVLIILVIAPKLYQYLFLAKLEKADPIIIEASKKLIAKQDDKSFDDKYTPKDFANYSQKEYHNSAENNAILFAFNPNTATAADWQKLGLKSKTIATIQNYLSKGGKFRKPEDLLKIYGLPQNTAEKLMPYVRLENNSNAPVEFENKIKNNDAGYVKKNENNSTPNYKQIDISTADTTAFIALPGIGSKLAARIVNYRTKLGGFYSINQLGETFGLPDSTFQMLKNRLTVSNTALTKISINTATAQQIKHPYLTWNIANAIVAYRNQHGAFATVADLKKIMIIDEATYLKIEPYLSIE